MKFQFPRTFGNNRVLVKWLDQIEMSISGKAETRRTPGRSVEFA